MKIPNYDCEDDMTTSYKQLSSFMPDRCFCVLICSPSGCDKRNLLVDLLFRLLYFDKIYLNAENLQQSQYQNLMKTFDGISQEVGYPVIEATE